jgi:hypothetical protein
VLAWLAPLVAAVGLAGAADKRPGVELPVIEVERAGACVEPVAEMRRDHMKMLLDQRDRTMRLGVRTARHSLKNCVDCHASARTGSVLGKDGFCESCHAYAAVRMDCFECHSPSPRKAAAGGKAARGAQ